MSRIRGLRLPVSGKKHLLMEQHLAFRYLSTEVHSIVITMSVFFTSVYLADSCSALIAERSAFISQNGDIIDAYNNNLRFWVWHSCC